MVGYLRLFLAYLVLLSHIHLRIFDMNPGVFAVVIFYILSGYVVTHLWDNVLPTGKGRLWYFYRDRALRIVPLYLYVCFITIGYLLITNYGSPHFTVLKLLANVTIIPLNYFMFVDTTILTHPAWCLVPPAWSLGAEEQAYICMSLLLLNCHRKKWLAPLSVIIFLLASFSVIHTDYFGYRLLPGVFFMFLVGHSMCRIRNKRSTRFDLFYPILLWLIILLSALWLHHIGKYQVPYVKETFTGLLLGIPVVYLINGLKIRLKGNALCGSLSYGLFLSHFLIIWLLDYCGYPASLGWQNGFGYIALLTLITLAISWVGVHWVEAPVNRYRKIQGSAQGGCP